MFISCDTTNGFTETKTGRNPVVNETAACWLQCHIAVNDCVSMSVVNDRRTKRFVGLWKILYLDDLEH
jgi:hypothetical protein